MRRDMPGHIFHFHRKSGRSRRHRLTRQRICRKGLPRIGTAGADQRSVGAEQLRSGRNDHTRYRPASLRRRHSSFISEQRRGVVLTVGIGRGELHSHRRHAERQTSEEPAGKIAAVAEYVEEGTSSAVGLIPPDPAPLVVGHFVGRSRYAAMLRALSQRAGVTVYVSQPDRLAADSLIGCRLHLMQIGPPCDRPVHRDLHAVFFRQRGYALGSGKIGRHRLFHDDIHAAAGAFLGNFRLAVIFAEYVCDVRLCALEHIDVIAVYRSAGGFGDILEVPRAGITLIGILRALRLDVRNADKLSVRLSLHVQRDLIDVHMRASDYNRFYHWLLHCGTAREI